MRWVIAVLTAAAALVAVLNEVASLARFAASRLNFPDGLGWTLPGIVTIATIAGALMWTTLAAPELRRAGRRLNVTCATISALAVGLDHAAGAVEVWVVPAFAVGALVPALATWLTHLLARVTDTALPASPARSGAPAKARSKARRAVTPSTVADAVEAAETVSSDLASKPPDLASKPTELASKQAASGAAIDWARTSWPVSAREIQNATGVAKGSAHRIRNKVAAEQMAS